jgi:hypothetical protein
MKMRIKMIKKVNQAQLLPIKRKKRKKKNLKKEVKKVQKIIKKVINHKLKLKL